MVRGQARRVLEGLEARPAGTGIYVEVGAMTDTTRRSPRLPALMRQQVLASLGRRAPRVITRWASGRSPTEVDLKRGGAVGFFIDGSLTALGVSASPPRVTCSVSLFIATYPGKSMFAFSKGGAEVDAASSSEDALAEATRECVEAVLDDLVGGKLVPAILARAP
jgi:hypothetical protein